MTAHKSWLRILPMVAIASCTLFASTSFAGESTRLSIASLLPDGSTWQKQIAAGQQSLERLTDGQLTLAISPDGEVGDELTIVRKMRIGKLDGALLTGVGLGEIAPSLMVLQAPGLFRNWDELEYARTQLDDVFRAKLRNAGYVLVAWGDVGFNHIFSQKPVATPADMEKLRPWCWTEDDVMQAWYRSLNANAMLTTVTAVRSGLGYGMFDSAAAPALAVATLGWQKRFDYMLYHPISALTGAMVIRADVFDGLPEEQQQALFEAGRVVTRRLNHAVRRDNIFATAAMAEAGIVVTRPNADAARAWQLIAESAANEAANTVYSPSLLQTVRDLVGDFRAQRDPLFEVSGVIEE